MERGPDTHTPISLVNQGRVIPHPPTLSLFDRYLKQIAELTFPQEGQLQKLNQLKAYNLDAEMHSLR